jgi:hypothetical protein
MAIATSVVTVGPSATLLHTAAGSERVLIQFFPPANNPLYVGSSSVTSGNGFPIYQAYNPIVFNMAAGDALYGLWVFGGTTTVNVMTTA